MSPEREKIASPRSYKTMIGLAEFEAPEQGNEDITLNTFNAQLHD